MPKFEVLEAAPIEGTQRAKGAVLNDEQVAAIPQERLDAYIDAGLIAEIKEGDEKAAGAADTTPSDPKEAEKETLRRNGSKKPD